MDLYILRHGLAVDRAMGVKDKDRALLAKGRKKLARVAAGLAALGVSFDTVLSSPLLRAQQSAEVVATGLGFKDPILLTANLVPEAPPEAMVEQLRGLASSHRSVLLVGHEPNLSRLVSVLMAGHDGLSIELKKGGLCRLVVDSFEPRPAARLLWLTSPKLFGAD